MQKIYKHRNKIILLLIILLSIPFIFNIGLDLDEPFTIGLVRHNYLDIVNLTRLDVHPPLYYLVLKLFLQITTFWTSNIFIKIIFARLLSVIFSVITIFYFFKLLSSFNIQINRYIGLLVFILMPFGLGKFYQITNIRMYAMGIMLMSMEMFYVNKLQKNKNNKYIFFLIIVISSSLYSNYFAGLTSGLYIIVYILYDFYKKDIQKAFYLIVIGITSLLIFLPWVPSLLLQSHSQQRALSFPSTIPLKMSLEIIIFIILLIILSFKKSKPLLLVTIINSLVFLVIFIISIIINAPLQRYFSFSIVPILFIFFVIIIDNYRLQHTLKNKIWLALIFILFVSSYFPSAYNMIIHFNLPSISFVQKFNNIKKNKSDSINAHTQKIINYKWNEGSGSGGNSIYLLSINKKINDKNYISTYQVIGSGNKRLFKAVFPNIEHYSTKKPK